MKEAGNYQYIDGDGKSHYGFTQQCVHCDKHYEYSPGSGKIRGWCYKCDGPVCGPDCAECFPYEKRMDLYEAGRLPELLSPTDCILPKKSRIIMP